MLIGVEDRSRQVRGVTDPLDLEERLASLVSDRITPRLVPEMPGLDSEALDFRAASESFASFRKLVRRDLETLRLLTDDCWSR